MSLTGVYLLHFQKPIAPGAHTAQHYTGSTSNLVRRISEHQNGTSARLCEVAAERGIAFVVARFWECASDEDARQLEKKIKAHKNAPRYCPICNPRLTDDLFDGETLIELALDEIEEVEF